MFDFKKFHKLLIQLLIPPLSDLIPNVPGLIDFCQRIDLFFLVLIEVFINYRAFDGILLFIIFVFMVIILNLLSFFVVIVV